MPDLREIELFRAAVEFRAFGIVQIFQELVWCLDCVVLLIKNDVEETFEPDGKFVEGNAPVVGDILPSFNRLLYLRFGLVDFALLDESVAELG